MSEHRWIIPSNYLNKLDILDTEIAIKLVKDTFERKLAQELNLTRVSAPLFVPAGSGLNDDLNGVERPVEFDIKDLGEQVQIVHSLAKWKRMALKRYGFQPGTGLYTDMNAIRRDEELDNLHSVYVDQWDWELVVTAQQRRMDFLQEVVRRIMSVLRETQAVVRARFPILSVPLPGEIQFITSQELEDRYPGCTPKEREDRIAEQYGAGFVSQIGGALRSGQRHDGRAPDYDDWSLNGDILIWYPVLGHAVEISSMGIRVDPAALDRQLAVAGCDSRRELPFHRMLLDGELPLTMGGGIGQSRICMLLLEKAHLGEVQASVWPHAMIEDCAANGIHLL